MVLHPTGAQPPDHGGTRPQAPERGRGGFGEREFADWLAARLSEFLQRPVHGIDPRTPFAEYGLDSVAALSLYGDIEEEFGLCLEPTVAWDHPTVEALARHLTAESAAAQSAGPGQVGDGGGDGAEGGDAGRAVDAVRGPSGGASRAREV
ncbi:acyl carrier protein [Streptomyces sp. NBC_01186]|uniref:acyl carrier protein n=1 Tax=Streptomyces sp. NBC_01186 TaxID=2903765 RepID=UPI003FA6886A